MSRRLPLVTLWKSAARTWLANHKYFLTLGIILLAHLAMICVEERRTVLVAPVFILLLYFIGFLLMRDRSGLSTSLLVVGLGALLLSAANIFSGGACCIVAAISGHATFLLLLSIFLLSRLFNKNKVSLDIVMAGVIVYLLMAGFWAQLYALVVMVQPGAIINLASGNLGPHPYLTLYYFSVTSLTTAGFGDVVPVSDMARILAAYE